MKLLETKKIWEADCHCAFTDLIFFKNKFYCTFREAFDHMSFDGVIRIISSSDGEKWELSATIELKKSDLRDPKLSITSDNRLMLNTGSRKKTKKGVGTYSITYFSDDGNNWSEAFICDSGKNTWRWSTSWHNNKAYSMAYTGKDSLGAIYSSSDGKVWNKIQGEIFPKAEERGSETSIVFTEELAYCLLRRDLGTNHAMLGTSIYPYSSWEWKDLKQYIGGPKMISFGDKLLVSGRFYQDNTLFTAVTFLDPKSLEFEEFLKLPSSGDCSYPGLVLKDDILYISYYSSHEDKVSIYFAKVEV